MKYSLRLTVLLPLLLLAACAAPVALPPVGIMPTTERMPIAFVPPPAKGLGAEIKVPLEQVKTVIYGAGQVNDFGIKLDAPLAEAFAHFQRGEPDKTLALLDKRGAGDDPAAHWLAESLRFDALMQLGRGADAEKLTEQMTALDQQLTHSNLSAMTLRGQARMLLGDFDGALSDLGQVTTALGTWSMPISYGGPPSNLIPFKMFCEAQMRAYTVTAVIYARRGEYPKALAWAEATEGLYRDLYFVLTHSLYGRGAVPFEAAIGRTFNLATLGFARLQVNTANPAGNEELASAGRFFSSHHHVQGQIVVQAYRTVAAATAGHMDEAIRLAGEGEAMSARAGLGDMVWLFAAERGETEIKLGHMDKAEAAFRSAQNAVEQSSGALSSEAARLRFGAGKERIVQRLAEFDLGRNDHATLFSDLERARSRAFVDLLSGLPLAQGRQAAAILALRDLDQQLLLQRLKNGAPEAPQGGAAAEARLIDERTRQVAALRQHDPELADTLSVATAEFKSVQNRLRPGEVLAYTLPARNKAPLSFLLIERNTSRIIETAPEGELTAALVKLREAITSFDAKTASKLARDASARLRISEWGAKTGLYLVPRGEMYFVPWGVMDISYPVAVLPMGGWLARTPVKVHATQSAVVAGDPDFAGQFPPLPAARKEAEEVAKVYGVTALIGSQATERTLRQQVGSGTGVLHLATHGFFNAERPLTSGLALSGGANSPLILTVARLVEAPLPAKLVVLSACETGLASAAAGDDFLGLPRSFYLGGTLAVVSSLWPVDDEGAQAFMRAFHEHARKGDYGTGWLAARNALKASGAQPFIYGAFVLGGALYE
ncbi:MAG: CHAT domain-containing protein [Gallionella sp.]|jgi:hypothetical protein